MPERTTQDYDGDEGMHGMDPDMLAQSGMSPEEYMMLMQVMP